MSLFRRHKHTWVLKAVQTNTIMRRYIWESEFHEAGEQSTLRYVCSDCLDDTSRVVQGDFTFEEAEELFPKP